ncbi:MAG TPA: delta-60 repeat domain-containing protein [Gemmataceae bacterium]|nr:delta-60 repeat domain-containing protein [Gemmataceae bacterium]
MWQMLISLCLTLSGRYPSRPALRRQPAFRGPASRPHLEALEDRCLLSGGALNSTFGNGGLVTTAIGARSANANAILQQPDDTTFGPSGNGIVLTHFGSNPDTISDMALQPNGKIVVAGRSGYSPGVMALARYTANGSLDNTFGTGGIVNGVLPAGYSSSQAEAVLVESNGLIVTAGAAGYVNSQGAGVSNLTLARFTSSGQLDTTFGSAGFAFNTALDSATALAVAANGDLLAAGNALQMNADQTTTRHFALTAFLPGGAVDPSIGTNGLVTTTITPGG